ncbi:MAG TPA: Hpt domain-containing protein [Stellaceae bacterium]|nr:Hpt domain-containing protein [Stellaceae bacterium]
MDEPPLVDEAVLDELLATIGAEAVQAVFELFNGETSRLIETITTGGQPDATRRAAHSLKSSAGQIGAAALSAAAQRIEALAAAEGDFSREALALAGCAAETRAAIATHLARRPPNSGG